jgi:SulP family sulfate permease
VLPAAFIGGSLVLDALLWAMGLMHGDSRWFVSGASELKPWLPLAAAFERGIDWAVFIKATTEIGAVAGVTVIALLLDVTGLEVARTKSANLDWEFRTNGFANVIAAPLGGVMGNLSLNGSRLLDETGGFARVSGVFASLVVVLIVVTGIDLPGLVPKPILAGLLMYLGLVVLAEVLLRSPAHRAWTDFALALAIMVAIVALGYLAGILFGIIAACLMFAFSYSRIAVIRRHLTRAVFASNVDRSSSFARLLQDEGDRIHVFWLSGFIFFGSSNGVFESIRDAIRATGDRKRRFAVLDFADVSGFDTSALLSLVKLRNFADDHRLTLAFAGLSTRMSAALEHLRLFDAPSIHRRFATRNEALEWCEDEVLTESKSGERSTTSDGLEGWLAAEIGNRDMAHRLAHYFERRDLTAGTVLYTQGSPADTIDLIATGLIAVSVASEPGLELVVRRMSTRTVVGEMGFFRAAPRTATVSAEGSASIYTLRRASYDKLKSEEPEAAAAFLEFIARTLSDRLDFATQGIAALS